jgi:hypothetical protein
MDRLILRLLLDFFLAMRGLDLLLVVALCALLLLLPPPPPWEVDPTPPTCRTGAGGTTTLTAGATSNGPIVGIRDRIRIASAVRCRGRCWLHLYLQRV